MTENISVLPEAVEKDVKANLKASEKIIKFICARRKTAQSGVYLVLTNLSVFFYSSEPNKEPVMAMLARRRIKEIEYLRHANSVSVTFIPFGDIKNAVRVKFLNQQRQELDEFCEDFADIISFKKETALGNIKTIITPKKKPDETKLAPGDTEGPIILHAASGVPRPELKTDAGKINKSKQENAAAKAEEAEIERKIEAIPPKIVRASSLKQPEKANKATPTANNSPQKPRPTLNTQGTQNKQNTLTRNAAANSNSAALNDGKKQKTHLKAGNALVSTIISVLAALMWYYFFYKLSRHCRG